MNFPRCAYDLLPVAMSVPQSGNGNLYVLKECVRTTDVVEACNLTLFVVVEASCHPFDNMVHLTFSNNPFSPFTLQQDVITACFIAGFAFYDGS